jgi:hypothetical protein
MACLRFPRFLGAGFWQLRRDRANDFAGSQGRAIIDAMSIQPRMLCFDSALEISRRCWPLVPEDGGPGILEIPELNDDGVY